MKHKVLMNMKLTLVSLKLIINLVALCKYIINLEKLKNYR